MSPLESWLLILALWAVLMGLVLGITDWLNYRRAVRDAQRRHPAFADGVCPRCGVRIFDAATHDRYCEGRA